MIEQRKGNKAKINSSHTGAGKAMSIPYEDSQKKWVEHSEELLNRPAPQDPPDIPPANDELPIGCDPATKKDIYKAIKQLKNGKSTGPGSIHAQAFKMAIETSMNLLYPRLICEEWKQDCLIKLSKKGDLGFCSS